jgi:four helix bundle protein
MEYNSFENMTVWQKAMDLAVKIHGLTERLPRKEDFSLTSQMRDSGLSVPGNISEGFGRKHTKDKLNFYYHARGSLAETKSHLIYGHRVGYFTAPELRDFSDLINEIWKELNSLINSLSKKS